MPPLKKLTRHGVRLEGTHDGGVKLTPCRGTARRYQRIPSKAAKRSAIGIMKSQPISAYHQRRLPNIRVSLGADALALAAFVHSRTRQAASD